MSKHYTHGNRLSEKHFKRIIRRDFAMRQSLYPIWGITWNLRGRLRCKLGTASMMALSYHPTDNAQRDVLELLCVTAQSDPQAGVIHYSDIRMAHDLSLNPFPGARDRILDPREDDCPVADRRERPNASWLRLALSLDNYACRSVNENWRLPVVPLLPEFYAGFTSPDVIDVELTPALLSELADKFNTTTDALLKREDVMRLATDHWFNLWQGPWSEGNESNLWVIDAEYTTQLHKATMLFEDFSELTGVDVWNPAREINSTECVNPVRNCAETLGFDLDQTLLTINLGEQQSMRVIESVDPSHDFVASGYQDVAPMTPTQFVCPYDEAVDRMMQLRAAMRESLGCYSSKFTDGAIDYSILHPEESMVMPITSLRDDISEADGIQIMRDALSQQPLISIGTTDEDLLKAINAPHAPLHASRLCKTQILYRDTRMDACDAFMFNPQALGRDRVYANLWAGPGWSPRVPHMERYDEPRLDKPFTRRVRRKHATA